MRHARNHSIGIVLVLGIASLVTLALTATATAQSNQNNPAFAACMKRNGVDISKKDFSKDPDMPKALAACQNVGNGPRTRQGGFGFGFAACMQRNGVDLAKKNYVKDKDLAKATKQCGPMLTRSSEITSCLKKNGVNVKKKNWIKDTDLPKALNECQPEPRGGLFGNITEAQRTKLAACLKKKGFTLPQPPANGRPPANGQRPPSGAPPLGGQGPDSELRAALQTCLSSLNLN